MTALSKQQAVISRFFPRKFATKVRRNQAQIRHNESSASKLSDEDFRARAERLLSKAMKDREPNRFEFAGMVANAVTRGLGFRLHDVQVLGIAAGMNGAVVQMQTGEGKTVVTGCVAAIMAFTEKHVHVGTTNAYLAERDREYNLPVWDLLGLSSGFLSPENDDDKSRKAYQQNITYGPGYQFGFDYLHDQIYLREQGESGLGQKTLNRISGIDINRNLIQPPEFDVMLIDLSFGSEDCTRTRTRSRFRNQVVHQGDQTQRRRNEEMSRGNQGPQKTKTGTSMGNLYQQRPSGRQYTET